MPPVKIVSELPEDTEVSTPVVKISFDNKKVIDAENDMDITNIIKMDDGKGDWDSCFCCSNLKILRYNFFCMTKGDLFTAIEEPCYNCKENNHERAGLRGQAINTLRLLMMYSPMAVSSLPENLVGSLGILTKYKLINIYVDSVKCSDKNGHSVARAKEKFAKVIEAESI
jgi:hypothetical protein